MRLDENSKVLIVGLGLMGGSYAKALKRWGFHVTAISDQQSSIDYALREGIIVDGSTEVDPALIAEADLIIFGLYPTTFLHWIKTYAHLIRPRTLVTDITGVKSCLVREVQSYMPKGVEFIAAHPMAGREVSGVENSDSRIFQGANYIVVPTETNTPEAIESCKRLGKFLGFERISVLSPEEHDEMIGFVSQLTHCIAVSLMTCSDSHHLVDYTGDSFRDLTRIARINDVLWSELFLMNKSALLRQMDKFLEEFSSLRDMLAQDDREGMQAKMRLSTERRSWFDQK
ncbi:MAG: prephenate dehydrogenase [Firmicutes bacterium]|nr:prephenate dehydrogenase [Bacillota bacterium]